MPFRAKRLFHTSHMVPDLEEATRFFARVFERRSIPLGEFVSGGESKRKAGATRYSGGYGTFTPIAEVLFECINPSLLVFNGVQTNPSVSEPHLGTLAWFADGVGDLWSEFRRLGLSGTNQLRQPAEGDGPPMAYPYEVPIIFTEADQVGLRYELVEYFSMFDPRGEAPPPDLGPSDPLGIQCCSHHTVLTDQPERARHFFVDLCRGRVLDERRNEVLSSDSVYVAFADGVIEIARPREVGSPAMQDWEARAPADTYHSLTWTVRDLDQVADHLQGLDVGIRQRTETTLVTDPTDTLGIPWGFTTVRPAGR